MQGVGDEQLQDSSSSTTIESDQKGAFWLLVLLLSSRYKFFEPIPSGTSDRPRRRWISRVTRVNHLSMSHLCTRYEDLTTLICRLDGMRRPLSSNLLLRIKISWE